MIKLALNDYERGYVALFKKKDNTITIEVKRLHT